MALRMQSATWTDNSRFANLVANAQELNVDYLVLEPCSGSTDRDLIERAVKQHSIADLIVVYDPAHPARRERLRNLLPPLLSLIASLPDQDLAVVIPVNANESHRTPAQRPDAACEFVVRLAEVGMVAFVEGPRGNAAPRISMPNLTTPTDGPRDPWLRQFIEQARVPGAKLSPTNLAALKAGLYLLNDFFDESHSCSQSIEGLGAHHTGDYWHAILHRREPD